MWACLKKTKPKQTTNTKNKTKTPITTKKHPTHAKFGHRFASHQMPFGTSAPYFTSTSPEWAVKQRWLWAERQTASTDHHLEGPVKSSARKTAPLFPFLSDLWFYKAHQMPHTAQICMHSLLMSKQTCCQHKGTSSPETKACLSLLEDEEQQMKVFSGCLGSIFAGQGG